MSTKIAVRLYLIGHIESGGGEGRLGRTPPTLDHSSFGSSLKPAIAGNGDLTDYCASVSVDNYIKTRSIGIAKPLFEHSGL